MLWDKPTSEKEKRLKALYDRGRITYGTFLTYATWIEYVVGDIIAEHFCDRLDRKHLLFSLVINGTDLSFSSKIDILSRVLEVDYPELDKEYPKIRNRLDGVRRLRNRFAHSMLDTTDEFLEKKLDDRIRLTYFEDGRRKQREITEMEAGTIAREWSQILLDLYTIFEKLKHIPDSPSP